MKRRKTILLISTLLGLGALAALAAGWPVMSVQVKSGEVRSTPSFLGEIVARLSYGDPVQVMGEKGSWQMVAVPNTPRSGWIHSSALTKKTIILRPGDRDVRQAATGDEIALAGKGFNQQVEGQYKVKHPEADYTWIDRMERIVISRKEMIAFLKDGGLPPQGGAQ